MDTPAQDPDAGREHQLPAWSKQNVNQKPILVLGGHGKTGSRVVARLAAAGEPVRVGSRSGSPRDSAGTMRPPGPTSYRASARRTSPTSQTWRSPGRPTRSRRSLIRRSRRRSGDSSCSRVAARRRPSRASESSRRRERTGRSSVQAGSTRTSARASCSKWSWRARSCCRLAMSLSRSSTPTTSPMWPSPR